MSVEAARQAWRDWLKSERRLAHHTLVAYEHDVATFLGVPSHPLKEELIRLGDEALRPLQRFIDFEAKRHALVRSFSIHLLRWMLKIELDGQPARFALPDALQEDWQIAPPDSEESFWDKLTTKVTKRQ